MLVNARHVKHVPGRKTDTIDAAWLALLLSRGLLQPSFVPPQPIRELRDLARGIAPPVLADRGLVAAVESLAGRSTVKVEVDGQIDHRLPPVVEGAAYFVVAETLTNVAKHAPGANARVTIHLDGAMLVVEIVDNGQGGANPAGGGLTGLKQRVEALDGRLEVHSVAREGTVVWAVLPCE